MIFAFNDNDLRCITIDEEPWFVAADVGRCLGLCLTGGAGTFTRKLADDEKLTLRRRDYMQPMHEVPLFTGNVGAISLINESGLYKLIMRCDKELAREFQDWVTREVLPAIRKTGGYLLNEDMRQTAAADSRTDFPIPQTFSDALRLAADLDDRLREQKQMTAELAAAREAERPKVEAFDRFMEADGTYLIRSTASILDIPERKFTAMLEVDGFAYRAGKKQVLRVKAPMLRKGLFAVKVWHSHGYAHEQVRVTPKGLAELQRRYAA